MASPQDDVVPTQTEADDDGPLELDSLCMNCYKNGTTRMLMTRIPHFKEVVVCSFECPHCGERNNEIQFAGAFGEKGVRYTLAVPVGAAQELSRQVVKSETATVSVPELDFEIPARTQKGCITTVEGLLTDAADNLRMFQDQRREQDPATAAQLDAFLVRLDACRTGDSAFTVVVDDPAGNSYVECPSGKLSADACLKVRYYERSAEQQAEIGLLGEAQTAEDAAEAGAGAGEIAADDPHHGAAPVGAASAARALARAYGERMAGVMSKYTSPDEVIELPGSCGTCGAPCSTRMFQTSIPYFKDVIIMSNACDTCGSRNAEVKAGGGISERGRRIELRVDAEADLRRDVIKSDTAGVSIPEVELEMSTGTLGGLVTTVEGVVQSIIEALQSTASFHLGDSAQELDRGKWRAFMEKLEACQRLDFPWTLILEDPLANSFVSPLTEDPELDTKLTSKDVERTAEEDEEYGIDHLKAHDGEGVTRKGA